jgi:transcriptional regulator with XRE-family HTH domain
MNTLSGYLTRTGTTQSQFAVNLGVRKATVSAWVNGVTPRPSHMKRIADATAGAVPVTAWFDETRRDASAA